jgi:carboxylesterase type B
MIVVVLQYRLGVLGQLPPAFGDVAGDPNLALDDVINGLTTIKDSVRYLGGDAGKVTVAGQSSGASMVRGMCRRLLSAILLGHETHMISMLICSALGCTQS